jgi:hypothetical protein
MSDRQILRASAAEEVAALAADVANSARELGIMLDPRRCREIAAAALPTLTMVRTHCAEGSRRSNSFEAQLPAMAHSGGVPT